MNPSPTPRPKRLPDALAARVLERAAQLDTVAARSVSLDDLRTAALGAGISEAALNQALDELAAEARAARTARAERPRRRSAAPIAALLVAGAAILTAVWTLSRGVMPGPPFAGPPVVIEVRTPRAPVPPLPPRARGGSRAEWERFGPRR